MSIKAFIKSIFGRDDSPRLESAEELRLRFEVRYHCFQQLLSANNRALEIMADMERALSGEQAFGMPFVRSACTAVSVNVLRMIRHLDELAPGKYEALYGRFDEIKKNVDALLKNAKPPGNEPLVISLNDISSDMADLVGVKMRNLGEIKNRIRLRVPEGFVVTAHAYHRFMEENDLQNEIDNILQAAEDRDLQDLYTVSARIQQMIIRASIPEKLSLAISEALSEIKEKRDGPIRMAVRSSALGEDMARSSFAGQYRSELNVSDEHLLDAYKEVVASKYSLAAMTYRFNRGLRDEDIAMSVGFLTMVDASVGGVVYSKNPMRPADDTVFISAAWGLPKSIVDGVAESDVFEVARRPHLTVVRKQIGNKTYKHTCDADEGVCREYLVDESLKRSATLTTELALKLTKIAIDLEHFYGTAQDIEWVITEEGNIFVLQCRPLVRSHNPLPCLDGSGICITADVIITGGTCASPGVASGKVFPVEKGSDVLQFPEGDILLTQQALSRWAPLLNRASAVVTQQGGFAGHLASVAREFGIPALFGVAGVTETLKRGDEITVDADRLTIFRGMNDARPIIKNNIMAGSPILETLERLSELVVPLNLLEPDSKNFTVDACQSFHDITRFVHEKSVHEMFSFGKQNRFPERSSKQLFFKVPMQWWIINLDDGYEKEVSGKYVGLENIVSIPMLAFWEGFSAFPWDGPPAIDGKGLASVMFHATTDPSLATGLKSKYFEKNHFMISRHYLNLNSRLGFHYSLLEAMVGERKSENYINFQFKGGAANLERRLKRVSFIGNTLEAYGFSVKQRDDHLMARIENRDERYMIDRLRLLGYLTLHTRQLDMIMSNPEKLLYYSSKMQRDIDSIMEN